MSATFIYVPYYVWRVFDNVCIRIIKIKNDLECSFTIYISFPSDTNKSNSLSKLYRWSFVALFKESINFIKYYFKHIETTYLNLHHSFCFKYVDKKLYLTKDTFYCIETKGTTISENNFVHVSRLLCISITGSISLLVDY